MAREVINIIERTNIIFIFMEITLDSSMLSHYVRRVLVLKKRLTREEKGKKDARAGATYLLEGYINMIKFRCLSSYRIVMVGLDGWTGKQIA
jgi:hypothetical protein